ncbi:DEAD/DEAH box helicase [Tsukamurella asaccharolytica]|uniref:DEAD/DEAH box helicase n=1 Tax=Tsukamurella asaccharolytica TaxID=2592067 RepID=A0A5C5RD05_9ACTN|nr:DEAD/DEAH box helicase [Tsukamurella asaccharolytica]
MIRRAGVLPPGAPQFSPLLDSDLLNYAYALLSTSLDLLDSASDDDVTDQEMLARQGFIQASYALEAAIRNATTVEETAFHWLIAGAASHLGGYAARAFSLMQASRRSGRLNPMEMTLADLAMRDLNSIEQRTQALRSSPQVSDDALLRALAGDLERQDNPSSGDQVGPLVLLLSENYLAAIAAALYALEIGSVELLGAASDDIELGEQASLDVNAPGPWWVYRLTRRLLWDLFETSIQTNIPDDPPAGAAEHHKRWHYLRRTFIESLLARGRSEIDLWPSQLNVVDRIFKDGRDLVVALPTSAGKTRIAELAVLACLAQKKRTVYVTPLRALSAQSEQVLERTFTPLGVRVSSLYGSMGVSHVDEDTLRSGEIVVATPEKLDFALRSDPSVLDDVGLVVLDEGHMIGASEREVRYEAQIQRLLRRPDASTRRILCLSAVFPSGTELDDFVAWITGDEPDGLHREPWRPTRQRFGLVEWRNAYARLTITLGADQPFIPRYIEARTPGGRRRRLFPADQRELVVATAWRLVEEGQTVLVFCPQRNSVEPYARAIIKLHEQGLVTSVLSPDVDLTNALAIGAEWFGADHAILKCLEIGVAIHHGALPGPFRREVERLLQSGTLKVTIASPTLAQGLNLSASAVLFHGLRRGRDMLKGSEFANVIGRAGRAFVDTEGLVLYPIFEPTERRRREWFDLTQGDGGKALQSGLIEIGILLLRRMYASQGLSSVEPLLDYLTGGPEWSLPSVANESSEDVLAASSTWRSSLALLDVGILSMVGESDQEADADAATQIVADALLNSLWERQLRRFDASSAAAIRGVVETRTRHLWRTSTPSQRRGWYLAGLGAEAGSALALVSGDVVTLAAQAEVAILDSDFEIAEDRLVDIAEIVFGLDVFAPETAIADWPGVLRHWVRGSALSELQGDRVAVAQFVESDLVYRLVWGIEAAKVFEVAQGNLNAGLLMGMAVTAIETGTFNLSASVLVRSGFDHRRAAILAVTSTEATFESVADMRQWIRNLDASFSSDPAWPTVESRSAWEAFASRTRTQRSRRWRAQSKRVSDVTWYDAVPDAGAWLRVTGAGAGRVEIWSPGFDLLGEAFVRLNAERQGVLRAKRSRSGPGIELRYRGPDDLDPSVV